MLDSSWMRAPDRTTAGGDAWTPRATAIGLAVTVGIGYFLAVRLSLALLRTPDGVAVFWPAAGIAAGALVALGPSARVPVAVGVTVASILGLIGERGLPATLVFTICGAGQAILISWLIERHHGPNFSLDTLPRVLGFFLATGIAMALGGAGGAAGFVLFVTSETTFLTAWVHWFACGVVGVVTVAPLMIGIARTLQNPPDLSTRVEGAFTLVVLAFVGVLGFGWSTDHWFTIVPLSMLLPLLVWPAARCTPACAAAAVFILTLVIVWTVTFGVGRLGDASVLLSNRVLAAQSALIAVSACTLVTAALFAERRSREVLLATSNERLRTQEESFRQLLGALPAAIYTTDRAGCLTYCNQAAVKLWGRRPELGKDRWSDLWRLHYPDGTSVPLDERPTQIVLKEGRAVRGREALLERPDGTLVPIMPCPAPLLDEQGAIIGVVNMQIDLTERKQAQAALAERDAQLDLAHKAAGVGSYTYDFVAKTMLISRASAAIYGLSPSTVAMTAEQWHARVYRDDVQRVRAVHIRAFKERRPELVCEFRYVRPGGEVRWVEARSLVAYDDAGRARRMTGVYIDVTERKQAEAVLRENESRLADALAAGQVIAFEWDAAKRRSRRSANAAPILGCAEGALQHDGFFRRVHPDDRQRFKACMRALCPDNPSYALRFRFRCPDGRQLWLEETAKGEFDAAGRLLRIKGLTRDITDRKQAERALDERNMQLSLAGRAALVGSFAVDFETEEVQFSEGYAAIHGLPDGTSRATRSIWKVRCASRRPPARRRGAQPRLPRAATGIRRRVSHYPIHWRGAVDRGALFHFVRQRRPPGTGGRRRHRCHRAQAGRGAPANAGGRARPSGQERPCHRQCRRFANAEHEPVGRGFRGDARGPHSIHGRDPRAP